MSYNSLVYPMTYRMYDVSDRAARTRARAYEPITGRHSLTRFPNHPSHLIAVSIYDAIVNTISYNTISRQRDTPHVNRIFNTPPR